MPLAHSICLLRNNSFRGSGIPLVPSRVSDDALYRLLNTLHMYIAQLNIKISDHTHRHNLNGSRKSCK
ncbi:hypothetical protein K443DRAFT_300729 [Laccaria amethystina LaAM-08-1]|uniref:Uncharacterized protein n=1 Tax=Laccaria amethystina LaAM-08-1 TaxID=1095629 RepID=A0A0C9XXR0_9AGAR|nr:hypothetical protein K443DRAFT_300729 [Laccaria amethystina LaAM-08-1]